MFSVIYSAVCVIKHPIVTCVISCDYTVWQNPTFHRQQAVGLKFFFAARTNGKPFIILLSHLDFLFFFDFIF